MKIAVVGAGAMGSLFGALLARSRNEVCLIDKYAEHVQAINHSGLRVIDANQEWRIRLQARSETAMAGEADCIIFFVKSYDTEQAAKESAVLCGDGTFILTMQNGLGNTEKLAAVFGADRIVTGTTSYGCTLMEPGVIRVSNKGEVTLGEMGIQSFKAEKAASCFEKAGISVTVSNNIESVLWTKLAVNAGINALTAIMSLKNGQLLQLEETKRLMNQVVREVVEVAEHKNIKFLVDDPLQMVYDIAYQTSTNCSSMYQDICKGKRTEIGSINGAVVDAGNRLGIATPANEVLTLLVQGLEKKNNMNVSDD